VYRDQRVVADGAVHKTLTHEECDVALKEADDLWDMDGCLTADVEHRGVRGKPTYYGLDEING
jgi:hypothetical protein